MSETFTERALARFYKDQLHTVEKTLFALGEQEEGRVWLAIHEAARELFRLNYVTPLTLLTVADSMLRGSFGLVANRVHYSPDQELLWITGYLAERHNWLKGKGKDRADDLARVESIIALALSESSTKELESTIRAEDAEKAKKATKHVTVEIEGDKYEAPVVTEPSESAASRFATLVRKRQLSPNTVLGAIAGGNWSLETPFIAHGKIIDDESGEGDEIQDQKGGDAGQVAAEGGAATA